MQVDPRTGEIIKADIRMGEGQLLEDGDLKMFIASKSLGNSC